MGGKKKGGKKKGGKKKGNDTDPDPVEKNFILQAEIESLTQKLIMEQEMADKSKASENEKRHRDLQLQKLLKDEENRKRDIVSDMTRQYKSRFEELVSKGNELEREKDENRAKIEKLDEDLDDLETKHKVIEKEKIDEITGLKRQIDEMSQEFAAMLKTTLEKMAKRIEEANKQWEDDNDGNVLKHFENTQLKQ